jgi:adenosine deaminase
MRDRICVFTLGTAAGVVAETLGRLDPEGFRVFEKQDDSPRFPVGRVAEVWVITTCGTQDDVTLLERWWETEAVGSDRRLRTFKVRDTHQLATREECLRMDEAILRILLDARRHARITGLDLLCSLSGGRKTMSATLQKAAGLFGCEGLFHVLAGPEAEKFFNPKRRHELSPPAENWEEGARLPAAYCDSVDLVPLSIEAGMDGLLHHLEGIPALAKPKKRIASEVWVAPAESEWISGHLDRLVRDAARVGQNVLRSSVHGGLTGIFPSLLRLPAETIEQLKTYRFATRRAATERELAWLRKLPKAELHCHLGGVLDPEGLLEVAAAVFEHERGRGPLAGKPLAEFTEEVRKSKEPPQELVRKRVESGSREPRWAWTCAALRAFEGKPAELEQRIFSRYPSPEDFRGLSKRGGPGLKAYFAAGDLQGSSLLAHPAALAKACEIAAQRAMDDGVLYLELRCSPGNYVVRRSPVLGSPLKVAQTISETLGRFQSRLQRAKTPWWWGLITMATRDKNEALIEAACKEARRLRKEEVRGFLGFDIAGDEVKRWPGSLREYVLPLLELCIPVTVHAGEVTTARQMWEAVYHLGAERLGHGLQLDKNPRLRDRLRERRVAIEMCPSSNDQVVGYRNRRFGRADRFRGGPTYPLAGYLEAGLRVTINTDNPAHSRTTLSREYLEAAWMSPKGLSAWDLLRIAYNGFEAAFLPFAERRELLEEADRRVFELVQSAPSPWLPA